MQHLPVIALVGRPNVGKSTLFNYLTKTRDALVADWPGLTRDRQYGEARVDDQEIIVVDTGGIGDEQTSLDQLMSQQAQQAIVEADIILLLVDGRGGLTAADQTITEQLRQSGKPVYLAVNKTEDLDVHTVCAEFFSLGLGQPYPVSASHGRGVTSLLSEALAELPAQTALPQVADKGIQFAIIGRPNVGKSTLVNRMLGEERVVVCDMPGTTRDSIDIRFERHDKAYTVIDTAGVRRRGRVTLAIEKFSVIKTLQAIHRAQVVVMLMDGREGVTEQDLHLLGAAIKAGRALVIAINKCDHLPAQSRQQIKRDIDRRLMFADFARVHYISALHGTGVGELFRSIEEAHRAANREMTSSQLTQILQRLVAEHQPPLVSGRRIKLRYAHPGGHNPPIIVIHGKQTASLPLSYQKYLINGFRKALKLVGTPLQVTFHTEDNPYVGDGGKRHSKRG
jgi:GTP-binding protein